MRGMSDIQFAPVADKQPQPPVWPEWLKALGRWLADLLAPVGRLLDWIFGGLLRSIGLHGNAIEIALVVAALVGVLWIAWMLVRPWLAARRASLHDKAQDWSPEREAALALLEDADRLAAEGRFGEAAHLLLQRSVAHIAAARPEWLSPSSTAREIGRIEPLPGRARTAFGVIATEVERSLFALRGLSADDWTRARAAYADFALADLGADLGANPGERG